MATAASVAAFVDGRAPLGVGRAAALSTVAGAAMGAAFFGASRGRAGAGVRASATTGALSAGDALWHTIEPNEPSPFAWPPPPRAPSNDGALVADAVSPSVTRARAPRVMMVSTPFLQAMLARQALDESLAEVSLVTAAHDDDETTS